MRKKWKVEPLRVKEIIHPKVDGSQTSELWTNEIKLIKESHENTVHGSVKIGNHEVKQVIGFINLQKKPLENYFEGTREKKQVIKKKVRKPRSVIHPSELLCDGMQTSNENWCSNHKEHHQTKEKLSKEEETEMKLLCQEIYEYETVRRQLLDYNRRKQRMKEQQYISEFKTLVNFHFPRKLQGKKTKPLKRGDGQDSGELEKQKQISPPQMHSSEQSLEEEFFEKLVVLDKDDVQDSCQDTGRN